MAVVIEELEADVNEPGAAQAGTEPAQGSTASPLDERALRELLARDAWRIERLIAD